MDSPVFVLDRAGVDIMNGYWFLGSRETFVSYTTSFSLWKVNFECRKPLVVVYERLQRSIFPLFLKYNKIIV